MGEKERVFPAAVAASGFGAFAGMTEEKTTALTCGASQAKWIAGMAKRKWRVNSADRNHPPYGFRFLEGVRCSDVNRIRWPDCFVENSSQ